MALVTSCTFTSHKDEITAEAKSKILKWLEAIGQDAAATAADKAPVGTPESTGIPGYIGGTLKNSISPAVDPGEQCVYIGTNVEYAPYQEFGTSRGITGKHFIQFGATAHQAEYQKMLEDALKE
jgi:phage gpG-like protein